MRKSPFLLFPEDFPALDFRCTTVWRNLLRRLLRLLPFCGTIVFDNAYPYLWFVCRAFGSPDIMQRAGLSIRNLVGVFWRMILFPTDSDGGDGYDRCGDAEKAVQCGRAEPEFRRDPFDGVGAVEMRVKVALSQPLPVPENGTISLSRAQSSLLELSRREMEHENEGIIEAFRGGGRRPRLFVGAGPFTSPECRPDRDSDFGNDGLSSLKGLYFFSVRSGSIYCISCD